MNEGPEHMRAQFAFDRISSIYEQHAPVETEVAARLLERVTAVRRQPQRIVDLGCGTGRDCLTLKRLFGGADVIGLDCSLNMIRATPNRWRPLRLFSPGPLFARPVKVAQARLEQLPLADQCVDLLYSNMVLHWCSDIAAAFTEFRRVLRPDGILLFTCLGPGALVELRELLDTAGEPSCLPHFGDLQILGDGLLAAGFSQPVVDAEFISVSYRRPESLLEELEGNGTLGLIQSGQDHTAGCSAESILPEWKAALGSGDCALSYEVIYGTAYGPPDGQPRKTPQGDVVTFSVAALKKTARR